MWFLRYMYRMDLILSYVIIHLMCISEAPSSPPIPALYCYSDRNTDYCVSGWLSKPLPCNFNH